MKHANATLTIRLPEATLGRLRKASRMAVPTGLRKPTAYNPTMSAIVLRGIDLALAEMDKRDKLRPKAK